LGSNEHITRTFIWEALAFDHFPLNDLDNLFSEQEIWSAILQMPTEKAPGPDDFTWAFYGTCWPIIKSEVIASFHCLYNLHTGPLPKLNTATITLLPKKELADGVKDFRPISLIHVTEPPN